MASAARSALSAAVLLLAATTSAQTSTPSPASITALASPSITAVSACHGHGTVQYCMVGTEEYRVVGPTRTEEFESQYTGCHMHGSETACFASGGREVKLIVEKEGHDGEHNDEHAGEHTDEDTHEHTEEGEHGEDEHSQAETAKEQDCHFHAGVEHCTAAGGTEMEAERQTCNRTDREYNIPLRIGLTFVILVTGGIGVFMPILATSFTRMSQKSIIFVILKQFGTGVVISTAFIHLFTHAHLMFTSQCLGRLSYEGVTAAVFMAGLFLSFLVDYLGARFIMWREHRRPSPKDEERSTPVSEDLKTGSPALNSSDILVSSDNHSGHVHVHGNGEEKVGVLVLEAGIIFHSLLIGLTLVVAGDSFFLTLFAVVLFHQMFEGIALGTCIAGLPQKKTGILEKTVMAGAFTLITPIGMAIGIGVLKNFNGNDPKTIVAIGTLDALSAGILAWVGIVEMLARDWMHGNLLTTPALRTAIGMASLLAGLILMSLLGKWA